MKSSSLSLYAMQENLMILFNSSFFINCQKMTIKRKQE